MEKKKIVSLLRTFICLFFFEIKVLLWSGCAPFCRPWYDGWRVDSSSFIVRWKPDIHATSFTNSLTSWEIFFCCLPFEWCCGVVCGSICLKWQTVTVSPISHPGYWVNHRWPLWQQQLVNICKFSRLSATYVGLTGRMLINPAGLPLCRERIFVHCGGAVWKKNSGEGWKKKSARDRVLN